MASVIIFLNKYYRLQYIELGEFKLNNNASIGHMKHTMQQRLAGGPGEAGLSV
jgi:hypothetical protein